MELSLNIDKTNFVLFSSNQADEISAYVRNNAQHNALIKP